MTRGSEGEAMAGLRAEGGALNADGRLAAFKAYDVRGRLPDELNERLAERIGRAYATIVQPARVVVGWDVRLSGPALVAALTEGLTASGVDVQQIGLCGTEEVYFATAHLGADGGIMVTASHNPKDYNGMKMVRSGARPISADSGLLQIEECVRSGHFAERGGRGRVEQVSVRQAYIEHLRGYVRREALRPLKIVTNAGNGCAGPVLDALAAHLPFDFVRLQHEPDGAFPAGVPNPLLEQNRAVTADAVRAHGADLGVAWDGDFDRCFLFDEQGGFIEGYYIVGLLAQMALRDAPGGKVIFDPRLTWNTLDLVGAAGGTAVLSRSGHAFIKEKMRAVDAVYGGEMSAHHYFRRFFYCDSGMIPWLLVAQAVSEHGPLSALVGERMRRFPASGEINRRLRAPEQALAAVVAHYQGSQQPGQAATVDRTDGISFEFPHWRFNLRLSNTEPLVRLNVESRADATLMQQKTAEVLALLDRFAVGDGSGADGQR